MVAHLGKHGSCMIENGFWKNKKVFITGHTGFKGSWLSIWLSTLGAKVYGYALDPPTNPSLFKIANVFNVLEKSTIADVRDYPTLRSEIKKVNPEIIFHLAAQPLVRESYKVPMDTYSVNVIGTVNILEAARSIDALGALVNVTTDKVYENKEWFWGYRENEPLGGYDPYSSSKACSEIVTSAYRNSFFNKKKLASGRAGNVIGGGDWATDRLIPDIIRTFIDKKILVIRNPKSIRPWQHVLEPLAGYMILAQKIFESKGLEYSDSFNFGPDEQDARSVEYIVKKIVSLWPEKISYEIQQNSDYHEANYLRLDNSKAKSLLGWFPRWDINTALVQITDWTTSYIQKENLLEKCIKQIQDYSTK